MAKKKISQKQKKSATEDGWLKVNPDRPFPPPPPLSRKKSKPKQKKSVVSKCGICNTSIDVTDSIPSEFYFCAKCTRGWFGKLGMFFVDLFVVFKSFLLGK